MDLIAPLLHWLNTHPHWGGALVFVIAMFESLALVGLFLPGAALMFGVGALVGSGALELWPTLGWAAAGAIAGDGVSFWLGRRFHQRLRTIWPFRTHPQLIAKAIDFFECHGGKGVLLGRFIGPIRPIIPAVAGMMDMPVGRFIAVNVVSGLLWAPAYIIPGMVFAASLGLAAEVATRLAVLLGLMVGLVILLVWVVKRLFLFFHPRAHQMIGAVLRWSRLHPVAGELPAALLDPNHPEARALTLSGLLLIGMTAVFLLLLGAISDGGLVTNLDSYVHHELQSLRTPFLDRLLVGVTELGDGAVLTTLFFAVLGWLAGKRLWQAAAHWVAAGVFAVVASHTLKSVLQVARPTEIYTGIINYAFPSGHALHSTVVLGFLAVLLGRESSDARRWSVYAVTAAAIALIAFSRLYLGAHWPSDVLGGIALGLAWVALLGIGYGRHPAKRLSARWLGAVAAVALSAAWSINAVRHFETDLARYAPARQTLEISVHAWWARDWVRLPPYRIDLRDERGHPLNLQYAGTLQSLEEQLARSGWRSPVELTSTSWLQWLNPTAELAELPILPQVHDGRNEALLYIKGAAPDRLLALRLWPSDYRVQPDAQALWIGYVGYLEKGGAAAGLGVPRTAGRFDVPLERLHADLQDLALQSVRRPLKQPGWRGHVLLVWAPERTE